MTRVAALLLGLAAGAVSAAAQTPPATRPVAQSPPTVPTPLSPPSGPGRAAPQAPANAVTNVQVQVLFDAYVISQSQRALELSNQQFEIFLPNSSPFSSLSDNIAINETRPSRICVR
jgi:hypothetical protein